MLPRRTFKATSRTAKKPANSLVNPWVSRMNSSAKQISPVSRLRDFARARPIFPCSGRLSWTSWKSSRARRLRAGICRQRYGLGKVESCRGGNAHAGSGCAISRMAPIARPGWLAVHARPRSSRRQAIVNGVLLQLGAFTQYFCPRRIITRFRQPGIAALEFQSAEPSVVKSIKQRDLLNTWLRLYARDQSIPRMSEYHPARIEDELPDLVFYTVDTSTQP